MRSRQSAVGLLVLACLLAPAVMAQHPVMEIKVAGIERLSPAAVIAASGLRTGQIATHADLDAAAAKLADTGFFSSVTYRYDPKTTGGTTGYDLTFVVTEQHVRVPVELDIPGQDAEHLWQQIKSANPLIDKQMPNNDRALDYYQRAIERVLRKSNYPAPVVMKMEANVVTGKTWVICRPAHSPRVSALVFQGNAAVATTVLEAAMHKVSVGQEYSERDFRRMLELNVKPIYEECGHLTVSFPRIAMAAAGDGAVTVTSTIEEGPAWRLGKVMVTGHALPLADMHEAAQFAYGSPANWKQFMECVAKMEQVLRRDGYIRVSSNPVRSFRESPPIVDVALEFQKGQQYLFGELRIEGLDPAVQQRLAELWKLPTGAPMNQPYINEFARSAFPVARAKFRTFNSELKVRNGNVVDVTLKFQ